MDQWYNMAAFNAAVGPHVCIVPSNATDVLSQSPKWVTARPELSNYSPNPDQYWESKIGPHLPTANTINLRFTFSGYEITSDWAKALYRACLAAMHPTPPYMTLYTSLMQRMNATVGIHIRIESDITQEFSHRIPDLEKTLQHLQSG